MKKQSFKLFIFCLVLIMAFVSCKKDDDENIIPEPANQFTYEATNYAIAFANFSYKGLDGDFHEYELTMGSTGLVYNTTTGEYSGSGDGIVTTLYSTTANQLPAGTYLYNQTVGNNVFDRLNAYIGWDLSDLTGTDIPATAGTITIVVTDSTYEITIACNDASVKPITAYFKGVPSHYVKPD